MTATLKELYSIHWVNFIEVTVPTTTMIFFLYCQRTINIIIILHLIVFSKCFLYFFCRGGWIWTNVNQLTFQHVISVRVYAPFIRFVIHSHWHLIGQSDILRYVWQSPNQTHFTHFPCNGYSALQRLFINP